MTEPVFPSEALELLRGKTILITGCASGIGREAAKLAHENGANLMLVDFNQDEGESLCKELGGGSNAVFQKADVSVWDEILEAFQTAWKTFGPLHAVISNAGINRNETLLEEEFDPESGKLLPPSLHALNVNLIAHLYAVRCAVHYFAKNPELAGQIVLTASAASFLDTPPLYLYTTAKTGLLGLMRSLRSELVKKNTSVNIVAPWLTVTPMVPKALLELWKGLPANSAGDVANALLLPLLRPEMNGKSLFVGGGKIFDFEEGLQRTEHLWMGDELHKNILEGQRRMMSTDPFT